MNIQFQPNTLYYGDCLDILSDFPDGVIDLICLDPPFNSNRNYNNIFKGSGLKIDAQIKTFDDTWAWNEQAADRVKRLKNAIANPASKVIAGFEGFIPHSKMLSYISYMAERLFVMHQKLKDTGSIYLHCDPYASHYLKLVMDAIFGEKNFRNEIVWCYSRPSARKQRQLSRVHDIIFWYSKGKEWVFNPDLIRQPYAESRRASEGYSGQASKIASGSVELDNKGKFPESWIYIPPLKDNSHEYLGYPTQKPLVLYERIIKASSNPGDLVLDPFAGCGTTVEAAAKNGRKAIGIDTLPFALRLINQHRIAPNGIQPFPIQGVPVDFDTAFTLAKADPFKFQDWTISLIDGFAANLQKVWDSGIDGFGMLYTKPDNMDRKAIIVQVTGSSGPQKAKFDRLQTTVRNENAAMGILITLEVQYVNTNWKRSLPPVRMGETRYPAIQCFSIQEYYQKRGNWERILRLPPLANLWTGKLMQKTLFETT